MRFLGQCINRLSVFHSKIVCHESKAWFSQSTSRYSVDLQSRSIWALLRKKTRPNCDVVPEGYKLVYRTGMENYIIYSHFSFLTGFSIGGLILGSTFICNALLGLPLFSASFVNGRTFVEDSFQLCCYIGGTGLLFPPVQILFQRTPLRMYYSPTEDKFLAFYASYLLFSTRTQLILPGQMLAPKDQTSEVMWWSLQHIYLGEKKRQKIVLFGESFVQPYYYNHLLGYQQ